MPCYDLSLRYFQVQIYITSEKTSVACAIGPSVTMSFQNLVFWNLFEFSAHQDLSNNTKGTFQFLLNFQLILTMSSFYF